jgi:asparagine synthase (glutamine-hydrolysing)
MCGIAGFTWRDRDLAQGMCDVIAHRGPDQQGIHDEEGITLGFQRLSILDLSHNGNQPMSNRDGSIMLVYNGEIYNYPELRPLLEAKGYKFRGHCDTEAVIYAYEEWGLEAVHRLRGMFAFALWDRNRRRLWLVRDRIGIKPLYYYYDAKRLIFASEIKAILEDKSIDRRLNRQALYDYLGFEFVPAPETMFEKIYKIPAGHQLVWQDGKATLSSYWDLSFAPRNLNSHTVMDVAEEVRQSLSECVKSHLLSDVPLGVFLSGGLDSSALVALMRQHIPGTLRTFTIGYPDKSFSELEYAETVAKHLGTEHHVLMIEGLNEELIEKSLYHFDEPMTDLSSIPLMLVCGQARKDITVCLSGEGGDEVFAGYDRFKASRLNRYYSMIPKAVRRGVISRLVRRLPDQAQKKGPLNVLKRFVEGADLDSEGMHLRWQYFLNETMAAQLFNNGFKDGLDLDPFRLVRQYNARCDAEDAVNRELYLDTRFMMTDSVLMKVDKMSMAHSLEVRVPMLDHKFVELNASLPGAWKLKGIETKHLFRKALKGLLPDHIVMRGKQGYSLPVKNLLRGQLRDYMTALLNESPVVRELMNFDYVQTLIREHLDQVHNHNHILWGLMNTALWHRWFLEDKRSITPS